MIKFNDVASQWNELENKILPKLTFFLRTGPYILKENVEKFEEEFAAYCHTRWAVGVSNGTDGLKLCIQALRSKLWSGPHPTPVEVIIPANAHVSSALAPAYFNLKTTLIDCDENHNMDVKKLAEYLKKCELPTIIVATHMYGEPADILKIRDVATDSFIIEDCSHAHGAHINNNPVGIFGDIGVFSLYPTKCLGAVGDAGIIVTNSFEHYQYLRAMRNYGAFSPNDCNDVGWNSRMDELQALILTEKLHRLDKWNALRHIVAGTYNELLEGVGDLILPKLTEGRVFHIYQIRTTRRDRLRRFLKKKNIPTLIHYPVPIHKTEQFHTSEDFPRAETYAQEILSLPIHPYLIKQDIETITDAIKDFFDPSCQECGGHQELMEDKGKYICRWCIRKIAGETTDIINPTGRYRQV